MQYGASQFGTSPYGDLVPEIPSPNATISLNGLGNGGRLNLILGLALPIVGGAYIDMSTLGDGGRLSLFLNKNPDGSNFIPFADAGELWKRQPLNSNQSFNP